MILTQILNEGGKTYLSGALSQADVRNRNGRIYPKPVLKKSILELKENISKNDTWAELEHPPYLDVKFNENVCGKFVEVSWDDDTGIASCKVEILENTKAGKKVLENIKKGVGYGISTRASGGLNEDKVVQEGLFIATADIVAMPSCQICYIAESANETEDFLLEYDKDEGDCGCDISKLNEEQLNKVQDKVVDTFTAFFKNIK